jgi:hypothetical protein
VIIFLLKCNANAKQIWLRGKSSVVALRKSNCQLKNRFTILTIDGAKCHKFTIIASLIKDVVGAWKK